MVYALSHFLKQQAYEWICGTFMVPVEHKSAWAIVGIKHLFNTNNGR